jgi:hypothetical protein
MRVVKGVRGLVQTAADVCIVGSGPVGLCLAFDLCRRGLAVVVLESGFRRPSRMLQDLSEASLISDRSHAPMSLAVCRALGGTSWLWGGRCVPLDPIDFEAREYVPGSQWPISEADISPYYADAARLLGCGAATFTTGRECPGLQNDWAVRSDSLERWSNEPNLARRLEGSKLLRSLTVALGVTVVDLEFDRGGDRVAGVVIASHTSRVVFRGANNFVLACGGLETTRLLLNVQARIPSLFGGENGTLGRYYMGHLSGKISDIVFSDPAVARRFDYAPEKDSMVRRRLTLSRSAQIAAGIPNTCFIPDNPSMANPDHESGILSAAFLVLSVPFIGRRIVAEAIRRSQVRGAGYYLSHLANVFRDLPGTAVSTSGILHQRLIGKRRKPVLFIAARDGRYPLHFHAEQLPNRESRVCLTRQTDSFGMRRLEIDLRFSQDDAKGIVRAHELLDERLRANRAGMLAFRVAKAERGAAVLSQAQDGFHQIGLTRMGDNVADGVVDRHCRVFGVGNLYIAGSSVFRTSGQANPTFSATALALRLSAHLAGLLSNRTDHMPRH